MAKLAAWLFKKIYFIKLLNFLTVPADNSSYVISGLLKKSNETVDHLAINLYQFTARSIRISILF